MTRPAGRLRDARDPVLTPPLAGAPAASRWTPSALACLAVLALAAGWPYAARSRHAAVLAALVALSVGAVVVRVGIRAALLERALDLPGRGSRWVRVVGFQLAPVVLLSLAYPVAQVRLTLTDVAGVDLRTLLLSVSLTVPWLGQVVCMPLYSSITRELAEPAADRRVLAAALADRLPYVLAWGLAVAGAVAAAVALVLGWSVRGAIAFLALTSLHVLFMQLLVLAVLGRRHRLWAGAWALYAAVVLVVPDLWLLPPLLAALLLGAALLRDLPRRPRPVVVGAIGTQLVKGALMGAVLWSDKLLLFLRDPAGFPAAAAFASLVPALIAYNYYFGRVAPQVDALVADLRHSMQSDGHAAYAERKRRLTVFVADGVQAVLLLGAALTLAGALVAGLVASRATGTAAVPVTTVAMLLSGWSALVVTLLTYKLAYLGRQAEAYAWCAVQCALVAGCLGAGLSLQGTYLALAVGGLLVVLPLLTVCMRHWQHPDYSLFWRQAVTW